MSLFDVSISIINKFCNYFKENFSSIQFEAFKKFIYAMLKDYKRLNLAALAKELPLNYEALQYFFSDSDWDYESLNLKRLNLLKRQRTTSFSKDGILAIDDTGSLKPHADKTEGVSYQYCPVTKGEAYCNVAVVSCFTHSHKHVPIELKFYKPESEFLLGKDDPDFRSKLDFAKELIDDAIAKQIPFSHIVFDSWYPSSDMIEYIESKGKKFISEVKSDRYLVFEHPVSKKKIELQQEELVRLIHKHYWHKTRMVEYSSVQLPAYSFKTKVRDSEVELCALVVFGKWSSENDKSIHILITNDIKLNHKRVFSLYRQRWGIEQAFQELKDTFYFDHYQVRHKEKIMRYWMLCILVWTLIYWIKQNAYLSKVISSNANTCNDYKQALLKLITFSSYAALRKNDLLYNHYFADIKSQRFKDSCYS
jgi:SRSO17 transposase